MTEIATTPKNNVFFAGFLPPHADYVTEAFIFPGTNAREPYDLKGAFNFVCKVMSGGREIARTETFTCDEKGFVHLNLERCLKGIEEPSRSFMVVEVQSFSDIPVAFYFAHIHKASGLYCASPALAFMGDLIYPQVHAQSLENTLIWPGLPARSGTEFRLAVANPYDMPMSFEASAWHNKHGKCGSGVRKVSSGECLWMSLDEWTPQAWRDEEGPASLCVSAQFKLVAWMLMVSRQTGVVTSADHLHPYRLC